MIGRKIFILLIVAFLLAACGGGDESFSAVAPEESAGDFDFGGEAEEVAFTNTSSARDGTPGTNVPQAQTQERLIIRTGELNIVVEETEETMIEIIKLAERAGGWVVNSNVYQINGGKTGNITLRIPAEGFANAVEAIKAMALEVTNESTSGQDVTDEFVDLSSRLSNLEATAARVRNFLDSARNVEEALAVNAELSRLEGDIEVIKGRIHYLSQSAAFSTLTVGLTPDELSRPIEVGGWRPQGTARNALEALISALQGLGKFLIWFVIFLIPLILIFGIPIWLFIRFVRNRRRRRRQTTTTAK